MIYIIVGILLIISALAVLYFSSDDDDPKSESYNDLHNKKF
jgi:hypothetical protein